MSILDVVDADCPPEVVDRLLWRNAQRILHRHVPRLDGTCHWCGRVSPCPPSLFAVRADEVSRMPRRDAWELRNEITRMLPVILAEPRSVAPDPTDADEAPTAPRQGPRSSRRRPITE